MYPRMLEFVICYDFDAMLQNVNDRPTELTQTNVPISLSICSNVEGHSEPLCIVIVDQSMLVQRTM